MLESLRQKIDEIDHNIISLLERRTSVVEEVGRLKAQTSSKEGFIRAGREATMVRRLMGEAELFPKAAIAAIWRLIISASLSVEHTMSISVYLSEDKPAAYWISREYFGSFTPMNTTNSTAWLISDILSDKVTVGILPLSEYKTFEEKWWINLAATNSNIRIFAHLPIISSAQTADQHFVAIAKAEPEMTGEDNSVLLLHADEAITQEEIIRSFARHHMATEWIAAPQESNTSGKIYHFIEVNDFIGKADAKLADISKEIGEITLLGSYAKPLIL